MAVPLISPERAAARARAAIAYAGLEHADVADVTGMSLSMVRRITSKTTPRDATIERLWAIADACSVPRGFMEHGWAPFSTGASIDELREGQRSLEARLATLEAEALARTDEQRRAKGDQAR